MTMIHKEKKTEHETMTIIFDCDNLLLFGVDRIAMVVFTIVVILVGKLVCNLVGLLLG